MCFHVDPVQFYSILSGDLAQGVIALSSEYGRQLIICDYASREKDFDHATTTDPTLFIHSVTDPDSDNTQWGSLAHDQTDFVITSGVGKVRLVAAGASQEVEAGKSTHGVAQLNVLSTATGQPRLALKGDTDTGLRLVGDYALNQALLCVGAVAGAGVGRQLILTEQSWFQQDHGHAETTDPTLFIHSATNPAAGDDTEWLSLTHGGARAEIESGKGALRFKPASGEVICLATTDRPSLQLGYGWLDYPMAELVSDYSYEQTQLCMGARTGGDPGGHGGNHIVLCQGTVGAVQQRTVNYDHGYQTNPTLYIHSATDPDSDNTQWMSLEHNQTNAYFKTGTGDIYLQSQTGVTRAYRAGGTSYLLCQSGLAASKVGITFRDSGGVIGRFVGDSTNAQTLLALEADAGMQLVLTTEANWDSNHDHTAGTDPTLYNHSVADPDDSNSEYGSLTHDGDDVVRSAGLGGHKFDIDDQPARGTMTLGGLPIAAEDFVINATTVTAVAAGATGDQFNIGADADETCDNIVATVNAETESANVHAYRGAGDTVIFEWLTKGVAGNAIVFTEAMTNTTVDGAGTLGGTHLGVAATTVFKANEDGGIEMVVPTSYANDGLAAAGGVAVGELYRNGSIVQIRVA